MSTVSTPADVTDAAHHFSAKLATMDAKSTMAFGGIPPRNPPVDTCTAQAEPPRIPILDRCPLMNETSVSLELISELSNIPGRYEPTRPQVVGTRCFLLNPNLTTRAAMYSLRDRLTQVTAILKEAQVPVGVPNTDSGNVQVATADLLHEANCLLSAVEIAIFEEHDFQTRQARRLS